MYREERQNITPENERRRINDLMTVETGQKRGSGGK